MTEGWMSVCVLAGSNDRQLKLKGAQDEKASDNSSNRRAIVLVRE